MKMPRGKCIIAKCEHVITVILNNEAGKKNIEVGFGSVGCNARNKLSFPFFFSLHINRIKNFCGDRMQIDMDHNHATMYI